MASDGPELDLYADDIGDEFNQWTTDEDLRKSLSTINVNDVIEIKFFENRANGQSKGFCVVTMQSDASVKLALEKFKQWY
ncbi:cleavage and polyadenylation specificity factor-like protein [Sarcoptes scabiei]|uniref:Cleavage and polyadenylation specificity factor-like protein n=1 Tax=Sarcoptes scabiei TaxID=52283 RepID=A0A132ADR7_SARSC|nr:cleavage and polyadenylation specificity factor-like protein [Sarcoptes scabiei]